MGLPPLDSSVIGVACSSSVAVNVTRSSGRRSCHLSSFSSIAFRACRSGVWGCAPPRLRICSVHFNTCAAAVATTSAKTAASPTPPLRAVPNDSFRRNRIASSHNGITVTVACLHSGTCTLTLAGPMVFHNVARVQSRRSRAACNARPRRTRRCLRGSGRQRSDRVWWRPGMLCALSSQHVSPLIRFDCTTTQGILPRLRCSALHARCR